VVKGIGVLTGGTSMTIAVGGIRVAVAVSVMVAVGKTRVAVKVILGIAVSVAD